jgi:hypothetical protein
MPQHKIYELEQSPLFKIGSKRRLCDVLNTTQCVLNKLSTQENYWIYDHVNPSNKKERKIYAPKPEIKRIQKRFQGLLSRISTPQYLFSGKKGICYIDNTKYHQMSTYAVTVDIRDFYTSVRKEYVFKFFRYRLKIAEDVAWFLADITTYNNFLPTGSPASQLLAFWAYKETFDRIENLAKNYNAKFSLFVDDMSFSSTKPLVRAFPFLVQTELKKVGLEINKKKTERYEKNQHKLVTGCIITPDNELKVPNKKRKEILTRWFDLHKNEDKSSKEVKSILGKIQSANQIQSSLFSNQHRYLSVLNKIILKE